MNSNNSHKPSSSDGCSKPSPKSRRKRHKRKSGGQPGHDGNTLQMTANPDWIIRHTVRQCRQCRNSLEEAAIQGEEKRQVFEIPPVRLEVTKHRAEIKVCPQCDARNKADFPEDVSQTVGYSPEFKARVAYLKDY
jgi:transposase